MVPAAESLTPPTQSQGEKRRIYTAKSTRRGRLELYGDILIGIENDRRIHGDARATRVQGLVNMPYGRFRIIIDEMIRLRLISSDKGRDYYELRLQQNGLRYLHSYNEVKKWLSTLMRELD